MIRSVNGVAAPAVAAGRVGGGHTCKREGFCGVLRKNFPSSTTQIQIGGVGSSRKNNRDLILPNPIPLLHSPSAAAAAATLASDPDDDELYVAVRVVQLACSLCREVQDDLLKMRRRRRRGGLQFKAKEDSSPVTVADWSVQATVSWILSEHFGSGNVSLIAEEDVLLLTDSLDSSGARLLESVVTAVNKCLDQAPKYGLIRPKTALQPRDILGAIDRCKSDGGRLKGKYWVLDPVDGTLGFLRGDQYAVALALVQDGEPVLGVLGCPNYPMKKEWLHYPHVYYRLISKLSPPTSALWHKGCVMYARKGSGVAWMQPLLHDFPISAAATRIRIRVSSVDDPSLATFCEPVENANTSHSFTAGLAHHVGVRKQPLRVYSMVKYAAIARGDAEIFMKFARAGYKEKIWDHAAGVVIIEEAGGVVTDAGGRPLDFSNGNMYLDSLDRGIIACSGAALHEKIVMAVDASWGSSSL